ncbi:hypothetical protein CAOG_008636 [Capsaspora owczarzaki ATCC 30864]|uniref:Exoribonuclease phosphorolytic domain-containing protein n=2 Tax=Capsaspora owczarzaki (strain ATCC 30864) TaxID=595528 RepID=A0A0D2X210_CAPO3|nr:hypothetical protein CAOG_008636 [Capsaspora owczarzaki ATCC 30864]
MSTGTVSHANGSAYLELAGTRVMAAVYGPRENTRAGGLQQFNEQAVLQCDVARAPFASPRDDARIGTDANTSAAAADRQFATSVATALQSSVRLEKYAKSSIDLFVTIIGDDGGALAASINCCTLALADAGIEMNDMVTAASVALAANTNIVLWDPTHLEESRASAIATQALRVSDNLVTLLDQSGESSLKLSVKALEACSSMSVQLHGLMQQTLVSSLLERRKQQLLP